jgi:hypothetical protein
MLRRNSAPKRDILIFSSNENCCLIPPTDRAVDASAYYRKKI